jgi:DNA-binding IclR family transcriptional regulator
MSRTTQRTSRDRVLSVLRRGPKKGLAAESIAERAGTSLGTTRTLLSTLQVEGVVRRVGTENRGFGRPANLYALAA